MQSFHASQSHQALALRGTASLVKAITIRPAESSCSNPNQSGTWIWAFIPFVGLANMVLPLLLLYEAGHAPDLPDKILGFMI